MAAAARIVGRRFVPWQRDAADLIGTLTPDGRRLHFRRVVIIVPRRAGKTLLMLAFALALMRRRSMTRAFYASHRRETAAAMWRDDWFPRVEHSPLFPRYITLRRSNGSEAVTFRHNLSTLRLLPPDGDAMRSFASDLAMIDEAREFTVDQGADFEAAAIPTQATGLGGQFWVVSNAGPDAAWLTRWRDLGRASVDNPDSQIAYLEYGAPDGADPHDENTWIAAHPGIGHHVNLDALRADHEVMDPDTFAAEYLGIWPETLTDAALVAGWSAGIDPEAAPANPVILAVELSTDRTRAVIVASGDNPDGRVALELIEDRPHGPWLIPRLAELCRTHYPAALIWDGGGPVGALAHELADLPVNLRPLNTREVTAAAGAAHDATIAGRIAHRDNPALAEAVTAARQRPAGGAWLYDRRAVTSLPWLAAVLARWQWSDGRIRPPNVA